MKKDLQLKLAAPKEKPGSEEEGAESDADAGSESSLDEEGKILEEMDDVRSKAAARLKKERKKRRESKKKARIRSAQLALSKPSVLPSTLAQKLRCWLLELLQKPQPDSGMVFS